MRFKFTMSRQSGKETNENHPSSGTVRQGEGKPVEFHHQDDIYSVAFLADGKQAVSGGKEQKIRCWRVGDGKEVGPSMDAGGIVWHIAVSRDGKWVVSGTDSGLVTVWDAESHKKVSEFKAHWTWMRAMDASPDGTKIATGSDDKTVCVWWMSTYWRVLGPLQHRFFVAAVKFSPNGHYIATATWFRNSLRIHSSSNDCLYIDIPFRVTLSENQSLAWTSDSTQLFALSYDGIIHCLNVPDGTTHSQWPIHGSSHPMCIALASNDTFIAVSAESSVSFWDTTSHKQIGSIIKHPVYVESIAISANCNIVVGGGETVTLLSLCDSLPLPYSDHTFPKWATRRVKVDEADIEETIELPLARIPA